MATVSSGEGENSCLVAGDGVQLGSCLPGMREALCSIPTTSGMVFYSCNPNGRLQITERPRQEDYHRFQASLVPIAG